MKINREQYDAAVKRLEDLIEFNRRIRCNRVAARYERQLLQFKNEHEIEE